MGFSVCTVLHAQPKTIAQPFILRGQLKQFSKNQMILFFLDPEKNYRDYTIDTITVQKDGSFFLKSFKVKSPTIATLRSDDLSVDLYAAPGYNMNITGDVSDISLFHFNKKISGKGSAASQYLFAIDSIAFTRREGKPWYEMDEPALLNFVKTDEKSKDSLFHIVFDKPHTSDKWFNYFSKVTRLDITFMKLYYLLSHATDNKNFDYAKAVSFVRSNSNNTIFNDFYKDEYMMSSTYTGWLTYIYPYYLNRLQCLKDSTHCNEKRGEIQLVEQIANNYKGRIKELKLYNKLNGSITYCRSFEELNQYKKEYPPYIAQLKSKTDQEKIYNLLASMDTTLLRTQIGGDAPSFTAEDSLGKKYSLGDYKGKVIYLDLWASWCAPCRYETPFMQKLTEKYKKDTSIVFISIAVLDKYEKWKGALNEDKPDWLQLFDHNSSVQNAYVANSIPKFILIDKQGKIVSFDTSSPSSGEAIEKILNRELEK
ncbi:MAG: TlpA disulfide reductase family protein [Agriterribacter sp.]